MIMMIYSFILIDCIMNPCDWIRVQDINFFLVLNLFLFFFFLILLMSTLFHCFQSSHLIQDYRFNLCEILVSSFIVLVNL